MIRPAAEADLPAVAAVYEAVLAHEAKTGIVYTNWQPGKYPTLETAREALDQGTLYLGEENGTVWGSVILNGEQLPEYAAIPWTIPEAPERIGVIHTLCVHPDQRGRGRAGALMAFCADTCRAQGKTLIRLDTWAGNLPANRLYTSLGYRFAGSAEFLFRGFLRETLNCYERALP